MTFHAKKWLRGLRGKFLFIGLAILCVFFGAGTGSLYTLKEMNTEIDFAYNTYARNLQMIEQMKGQIHAVGRFAWVTHGHAEDHAKRLKFLDMGQEAIEGLDQNFLALKNQFSTDKDMLEKWHELEQFWPNSRSAYIDASNLFKKNDPNLEKEIKEILTVRLAKNLVPLTGTLNEFAKSMALQSQKKHELLDQRLSFIKK